MAIGKIAKGLPQTIYPTHDGQALPPEHMSYLSDKEQMLLKAMTDGHSSQTPWGVKSFADDGEDSNDNNSYSSEPSYSYYSNPENYASQDPNQRSYDPSQSGQSTQYASDYTRSGDALAQSSPWWSNNSNSNSQDSGFPPSQSGSSSFAMGQQYSPLDMQAAGYGQYPSGQGLSEPNSGSSTVYAQPPQSFGNGDWATAGNYHGSDPLSGRSPLHRTVPDA